jgi:hypothetical protein
MVLRSGRNGEGKAVRLIRRIRGGAGTLCPGVRDCLMVMKGRVYERKKITPAYRMTGVPVAIGFL